MPHCSPDSQGNCGDLVGSQGNGERKPKKDQDRKLDQAGATATKGGKGVCHKRDEKQK